MKPTQFLDACRNIRKEIVAFISIVMIGLLAAVAYLGIVYTAAALRKDALNFFNTNKLWDLEVSSTMLMTDEDLELIRAIPGVGETEPVWQIDTKLRSGYSNVSISVVSLSEHISLPVLLEGRLPDTVQECTVEQKLAEECGLAVGQSIRVDCGTILEIDPLAEHDFVITGIFHTPDHFSYMVPVTPYILVQENCFNREGLDGAFMKTRIRVEGAPEDRYSDAYRAAVNPVAEALETLGAERGPKRTEQLQGKVDEQASEGREQIEKAREELDQARETITEGWRELATWEAKVAQVPGQLAAGEAELLRGEAELVDALELLEKTGIRVKGNTTVEKLEDVRRMLDNPSMIYERMELRDALPGEAPDLSPRQEQVLQEELKKLRGAIDLYEFARNNYYYAGEEYLDALTRIENGRKQLAAAEEELAAGEEKIRSAEEELQKALVAVGTCRWVVLDNNGNPGVIYADANSDKLSSLSMSFSSIFLIVGALVIYATVSRMVEQQRKLIGVNKALGLFNREILAKYLLFACSAVLLGIGLGIALAYYPMQRAVLSSYEVHLNYGEGTRSFLPFETGLVVAGALAIAVIAVCLGCAQLLRQSALALMQGAQQDAGRKKKSGSSARKSLYFRLILRNMLTDRNRVLVTIVSIAGGCVLMVIGFTLRYGISGVPDRQFGGILTYDAEVFIDPGANAAAASEVKEILDRNALRHIGVRKENAIFEMDGTLDSLTVIAAEKGSLNGYFALRDLDGGETMELPDSGALVPRRFWEYYGAGAGASVPVFDSGMERREIRVADVFENYYGQLFFMTPQGYEEAFGVAPEPNCFFVKTDGMPLSELEKQLDGVRGLVRVDAAAADRVVIEQFTSSLNFVVYLMLFIAGMMACFIVANFTLTFVQRKTGELTIMRINGFTSGECIRYVAVDLVVTTILGTLVGMAAGGVMGFRILSVTETPYIQMIREPRLESFLFAALVTFGFSILTNGFALRRIRRLRLVDLS